MSHFPRVPVRFLESNEALLKSQTEEVAVRPLALIVKSVATAQPNEGSFDLDQLAKSEALSGGHAGAGTDYNQTESAPVEDMHPQFRAPRDRNLGNVLFRRNIDSSLDMQAAKHVVVDAVHRACDSTDALNDLDKMVLSVFFPGVYMFVDAGLVDSMASVHMRLAPHEIDAVRFLVAAHLKAEMSYNAGLGGGGDPGRLAVRS